MNNTNNQTIKDKLFALKDEKYADFQAKLVPAVGREKFIGVRTPALKKLAKILYGTPEANEFLNSLPHEYFDENNLHGFLLYGYKDFDECLAATERFLPYVNNWATCDQTNPPALKKNLNRLAERALEWIKSDKVYVVRYGIITFMRYFSGENYKEEYAEKIANINFDEYYVRMMQGWYFATVLAKNYNEIIKYFEKDMLPEKVKTIAVRKACESFRVSPEQKEYLRSLRKKTNGR